MNPEFKRYYFQIADWPQEWIDAAEKTLRCHWERWYKPTAQPTQTTTAIVEVRKTLVYLDGIIG